MIKERITVDIEVEDGELCGRCHMLIPIQSCPSANRYCGWFCKAYITELWTRRNDARRCDECRANASAINN